MVKKYKLTEKFSSITSSLSGFLSFLGGYQVCHNICLGIVALLSIIGISVAGMPLLFLQKVAIPFWVAAVALLLITLFFYFKKKCISKNLITFNVGVIIAGTPFQKVQNYSFVFWIIGGILVLISIFSLLNAKFSRKYKNI